MKLTFTLLLLLPVVTYAQQGNFANTSGGFIGLIIGLVIFLLIFLALRQIMLWYWKINTLVAYQEQQITALQALYNNQEQLVKLAREQTEILRKIRDNSTFDDSGITK